MMIDGKFLKRLAIASAVLIAAGAWPLMRAAQHDSTVIAAALVGFLLSTANVLAGYAAIVYGRKRGAQTFNLVVLGGMPFRMFLMLGLIWICVSVIGLPPFTLVASMFLFYVTFLAIEVQFLWSTSRRL